MSFTLLRGVGACLALALAACGDESSNPAIPPPSPIATAKTLPVPSEPARLHQAASPALPHEPDGTLSLQAAVSLALVYNPDLAAFSIETRAAEARTLQADRPPNPEIEALTEDFGGARARRGFNDSQTTVTLSQVVELGAKRAKRVRLGRLDESLAAWDYEVRRLDVLVATAKAFTDVLAAQRRVELANSAFRLEQQLFGSVAERVSAGQVSPLERGRAQVALSGGQVARDKAARDLQVARSRLSALWASTHPVFGSAEGDLGAVAPVRPLPELLRRASDNPDLARWTTEIEQREARVALERAKDVPDPRITVGARRYGYNTGETAFVAGVSIPLPFYSLNRGGIQEAELLANKARVLQQAASVQVAAAIEQSFQQVSGAYDAVITLRRDVLPAAKSTFDGTSNGYREGKFTLLEALDAQRVYLDGRGRLIDAEAAYQAARTDAERLIGQSLTQTPNRGRGDLP
jgi:cobalt-zinc-cadmium efflux system outer membrane protein